MQLRVPRNVLSMRALASASAYSRVSSRLMRSRRTGTCRRVLVGQPVHRTGRVDDAGAVIGEVRCLDHPGPRQRPKPSATCSRFCTWLSRPGDHSGLVTAAASSATRRLNASASTARADEGSSSGRSTRPRQDRRVMATASKSQDGSGTLSGRLPLAGADSSLLGLAAARVLPVQNLCVPPENRSAISRNE
jgi:hypothetical protein